MLSSPAQRPQNPSGVYGALYEEAPPRGHYATRFDPTPTPSRDDGELDVFPPYHSVRVGDWREPSAAVPPSFAPWAYSPPAPPSPRIALPRSPPQPPRAATSPRSPLVYTEEEAVAAPPLLAPDLTLVGQLCAKRNCYRQACPLYGDFCEFHKPSRLCKVPECRKCAKTGGYCIAHGGGRRCQADGCAKSAKEGGYCIAHGGGKRCQAPGCDKAASAGGRCAGHSAA